MHRRLSGTRSVPVRAGAARLLRRKHASSAIFAANDDMAAGVIRIADRLGIDVPRQLSVAGFDSLWQNQQHAGAINLDEVDFSTTIGFNVSAMMVILILIALYATWW